MEIKETLVSNTAHERIGDNNEYFRYIFKKTEKIACAVFYILRSSGQYSETDLVVRELELAAQRLLSVSLSSLNHDSTHMVLSAHEVRHALIVCESQLRVAYAASILDGEYLNVFTHEIDSAHRALRKYIDEGTNNPFREPSTISTTPRERKHVRPQGGALQRFEKATPTLTGISRKDRILAVIRDKKEVTIKDISEIVTDCSEKTIQRELIELIKDSRIVREGDKRWSKYKIFGEV